jgi:hypothetical protein
VVLAVLVNVSVADVKADELLLEDAVVVAVDIAVLVTVDTRVVVALVLPVDDAVVDPELEAVESAVDVGVDE